MKIAGYELNQIYDEDVYESIKKLPDKCFELAIVDPPYGGGATQESEGDSQDMKQTRGGAWQGKARSRFGGRFDKYEIKATPTIEAKRTGGGYFEKYGGNGSKIKHWDVAPPPEYFTELFRVSKNQIIWGGNYFDLPPTRCFLVWRKLTISEGFSMAMCEYAWTSFNDNAKWIELAPQGNAKEQRFHPTQKPVALYKWLLNNYAKPGDKILDTHLGSGSSVIACHDMGFEYLGFELDPNYHNLAVKRIENHKKQINMFNLDQYDSVFDAVTDAKQEGLC